MNPTLKYALARLGLFVAVALPLVILVPQVNLLLKLMIAVIVSAILAYFFLRGLRDEVAIQLHASRQRRLGEKEKLRAALAGEDEPSTVLAGEDQPSTTESDKRDPSST